jgi:hypothetical protein
MMVDSNKTNANRTRPLAAVQETESCEDFQMSMLSLTRTVWSRFLQMTNHVILMVSDTIVKFFAKDCNK